MFKEKLTDPKEHDSNNFIYIVHALLNLNGDGINPEEIRQKVDKILDPDQYYRASIVGCLDEETAKQKLYWHGGEVKHTDTFGSVGLIVNPAIDGLVSIAWNSDIGSPFDPEELKEFVMKHQGKIKDPFALLTKPLGTGRVKYNELIIMGHQETEIQGVFYKHIGPYRERMEANILAGILSKKLQKEIPIIELPSEKPKTYDDLDPKDRELVKEIDFLRERNEHMQAHFEFHTCNPPYRDHGISIPQGIIDELEKLPKYTALPKPEDVDKKEDDE